MSASTAHAATPRSASGVRSSRLRGQEDFRALEAFKPPIPQALSPSLGSFGGHANPQALPPGVHRGRTSIEPLRRLPSQLDVIDDLLDGGLPRGRVSELVGPLSSGKTSLLIAFLAAATRRSEIMAYVDLADSLQPPSFAAAGVELERLLWVRPTSLKDAVRCTEIILQAGGFAAVALDLGLHPAFSGGRVPQPSARLSSVRPEERALPSDRVSKVVLADAQTPFETAARKRPPQGERMENSPRRSAPIIFRLNVWPRLARAAEKSHAALIVLAPQRITGSVATLGIEMRARPLWSIPPSPAYSRERAGVRAWPLFDGFDVEMTVARNKLGPPGGRCSLLVARRSIFP
jgi:hypothetical protein